MRILGTPALFRSFGMWHASAAALGIALEGDDGVDMSTLSRVQPLMELFARKFSRESYGDKGWMSECDGEDRMFPNAGYSDLVVALRAARGIDPTAYLPNLRWAFLKYVFFMHQNADWDPDSGTFGWRSGNCEGACLRGHYNHGGFVTPDGRWALTHGGDFAGGFGLLKPYGDAAAAALWSLNHTLAPFAGRQAPYVNVTGPDYDVYALGHRGVQAFVNWPYNKPEVNPALVVGHNLHDTTFQMLAWRNRWENHQDSLLSFLPFKPQSPDLTHGHFCRDGLMIQSLGFMPPLEFPNKIKHQPPH